jgi:hypothetical protein
MAGLSLSQAVQPKMSLKKRTTAKSRLRAVAPTANYVLPEFNPPPANRIAPQPLTRGYYSPSGEFHTEGLVNAVPAENGSPQGVNFSRFRFNTTRVPREGRHAKSTGRKTKKLRGVIQPENWGYYERAVGEIQVPPLFHPLTGEPLNPEEDALDILQDAIDMLEGLIEKAVRRARTLKRQNLKRASSVKPKSGV